MKVLVYKSQLSAIIEMSNNPHKTILHCFNIRCDIFLSFIVFKKQSMAKFVKETLLSKMRECHSQMGINSY